MKYKIRITEENYCIFRYKLIHLTDGFRSYGRRYLYYYRLDPYAYVFESEVVGFNDGSQFISTRTMFKLAVINNFLDKLKEMCFTDLNQKQ